MTKKVLFLIFAFSLVSFQVEAKNLESLTKALLI